MEGLQVEGDLDLQVTVHQLKEENRHLRLRLEDQSLGLQESQQEELMALSARYVLLWAR